MDDPLIWILVAGVVGALAFGAYLFVRRRRAPREEPFLHFRCTKCKRRIRFRAGQAGHTGQCSHCGAKLTFPHASQSID